jgi:hypothetical protein
MNTQKRIVILILCGLINLLLSYLLPMEGGGAAMLLFITIPFNFLLGLIFGTTYYIVARKSNNLALKKHIYYILLIVLIIVNVVFFPHA